jgi:hypothetical protein
VIDDMPPVIPAVQTILERERVIPALPPAVRARALTAARAALASQAVPTPPPRIPAPWIRWAAAAALTVVAGAATAAVAYRRHAERLHAATAPATAPRSGVEVTPVAARAMAVPAAIPETTTASTVEEPRRSKVGVPQEELRLLRQARAAVAREDFTAALRPIAEHTHRFRDGRLAEEREALRVKALAGLGRKDEARRAAAGFENRFPRSVLLPAVRRISPAGE